MFYALYFRLLTFRLLPPPLCLRLFPSGDGHLVKPFNKKELLVRIDNLIEIRKKLWKKYATPDLVTSRKEEPANLDDSFVQKAIDLINENLDNPDFGQDLLSDGLYLSSSQVYRKIKALTGKSTAIFIRWVRLQHALKMLESSERSVSEVAYACGFNDPAWFSRAFKEEFGYPPSAVIR